MRRLAACVVAVLFATTVQAKSEVVEFPVTDFVGDEVSLRAVLNKPAGDGPFPAVVLLHGCDGLSPDATWTDDHPFLEWGYDERPFLEWGYVTLWIDSFGPRGLENACNPEDYNKVGPTVRTLDAYAGKEFLAGLSFVDANGIGVVGWSHGGWTVLKAVSNDSLHQPSRSDPFKAAVAFFPWCLTELRKVETPLLVLIGDADDWAPSSRCEAMTVTGDAADSYELVVFLGATHSFDWEGASNFLGYEMRYDPQAAAEAFQRTKVILNQYLRQP